MNTQAIGTLIGVAITLVCTLIGAAWKLASKIDQNRADVLAEVANLNLKIAQMQTELAVMREREEQRAQKIEQMWKWWLMSLERGWMAHMSAVAGEQRESI